MIKCVIFDLDNTLTDFMKMKKMSSELAVDSMIDAGLNMSKEAALERIYAIYDVHGYEYQEVFQKFLSDLNGKVDYRILSHAIVSYREARVGFLHPYPGTRKTLSTLKEMGVKIAIVTDAPRINAWIRLSSIRLDDLFDIVVSYDDTMRYKPSKLPFKKALSHLKERACDCIMVGDSPGRDIVGARSLGMKTCHALYGYEGREAVNADHSIRKIDEIIDIVNNSRRNTKSYLNTRS